jgi:predicted nucleic-acid-binding protein
MLAVDTNVVVRFLVRDEPGQSARAGELLHGNGVRIAKTVLLETEWVLRSVYGYTSRWIAAALRDLAGLPTIHFEDAAAVALALDWFEEGMDFADAMHLTASAEADAFASFNRKLATTARRVGAMRVVAP